MFDKKRLFEHIAWCLVKRNDNKGILGDRTLSLQEYLQELQMHSEIKENTYTFPRANIMPTIERKYWIVKNDLVNIETILDEYKKDLTAKYFTECLTPTRWIGRLHSGEYFILTLFNFLEKSKNERLFCGNEIRTYKRSDDNYNYYELTDFGIVYYKLLTITVAYCITLDTPPSNLNLDNYTKTLDSNTLTFFK
jgi:hypothetical protein